MELRCAVGAVFTVLMSDDHEAFVMVKDHWLVKWR